MFEFFLAFRYLIPRKKALSSALLSLVSLFVISLVVWLIVVFLSVTEGIEKNWVNKLTTLNAPIRIVPTDNYYTSYYYLIDGISSSSGFSYRTIGEKVSSPIGDPYNPQEDMEIPPFWPKPLNTEKGAYLDFVKQAYSDLDKIKKDVPSFSFQDYETAASLLKVALQRQEGQSFLTQMTYLTSFPNNNLKLYSLLKKPEAKDLNNLALNLKPTQITSFFKNLNLNKVKVEKIPLSLLKGKCCYGLIRDKKLKKLTLPLDKVPSSFIEGKILYDDNTPYFEINKDNIYPLSPDLEFHLSQPIILEAKIEETTLQEAKNLSDVLLIVKGEVQGKKIAGKIAFESSKIFEASIVNSFSSVPDFRPLWPYQVEGKGLFLPKGGVLLPLAYKQNKVLLGDRAHLIYSSLSALASEEKNMEVYVAGFYDPGVFPVGNRCLLVPTEITRAINSLSSSLPLDSLANNGISVWFDNLNKTKEIKNKIEKAFKKNQLSPYFDVITFEEYEFSRDLMQQFKSDKNLFVLIAIIILIVASSNIISMLILLVNDKKKEIATLLAMGAKPKSIACIFGICGLFTGLLSSILGMAAGIITLKHLNFLVSTISKIQGHALFNPLFFGSSLPNSLSMEAVAFILLMTSLLSILAGTIPALKASKISPAKILRSQ